jgi:hypothetical protein
VVHLKMTQVQRKSSLITLNYNRSLVANGSASI